MVLCLGSVSWKATKQTPSDSRRGTAKLQTVSPVDREGRVISGPAILVCGARANLLDLLCLADDNASTNVTCTGQGLRLVEPVGTQLVKHSAHGKIETASWSERNKQV